MLHGAVRIATLVALLVALPAAWQRRELRPLAALSLLAFFGDPLGAFLTDRIVTWQEAARIAGADPLVAKLPAVVRLEAHVFQALTLAWAPAVSAVVARLFGHRARLALLVWAAASILLIVGHQSFRGYAARPVYLAADVAAFALALRAVVRWAWLRASPQSFHFLGLALLLLEGARLLAYHGGPWTTWDVARVPLLAEFLVIAAVCGGALCSTLSSRSLPSESR